MHQCARAGYIGSKSRRGGNAASSLVIDCSNDEWATGIYAKSGTLIDQVGLACEKIAEIAPAKPTTSPKKDGFCRSYAIVMTERANEAKQLNCAVRWPADNQQNFQRCMATPTPTSLTGDRKEIEAEIAKCKASGGSGGAAAVTKTVIEEVTMYDKPNGGNDVCYLNANDKVTVLTGDQIPVAFRKPADTRWVPVRGNTGGCNGKVGGVYDDGKLR